MNSEMKQELEKEWRRNKVLELSSKGYSERDIGSKLQISHITVHRDLVHLKRQAQENLQHHIHEVVPMEYSRFIFGMKGVLKQTLEIAETSSDPKIKLEAMRIANDCYHHIMDLTTSCAIVTDAIKYVTQKQEQIDTLHKLDERIEATEVEETTTTNGVF
ncbi:MAG: hypothetical protein WBY22_03005 [Nitrososphaeraceae archaeon]